MILGRERADDADYLDACRSKRNTVEYDMAGAASPGDSKELITFAKELREAVISWLHAEHPHLVPKPH